MNHKRGRPKNRRAGCLLCKDWKQNGYRTERKGGERWSDHKRRTANEPDIAATIRLAGSRGTDYEVLATVENGRLSWSDYVIELESRKVTY